jgi:predicted ArsR family transcriptional regulator
MGGVSSSGVDILKFSTAIIDSPAPQGDVGRDEAARAVGVSRTLAGFHLDRLVKEGLLEASFSPQTHGALEKAARTLGERIGAEARTRVGSRPSRKRLLAGTVDALAAQGYEPVCGPQEIRLCNCPFHALVSEHKELVCGMNLALIEGFVAGVALSDAQPVLDPQPGMCCVAVKLAASAKAAGTPTDTGPQPQR